MSSELERRSLEDVFKDHELVNMSAEGYIVVTPRQGKSLADVTGFPREIGTTGQTSYGSYLTDEYNPDFRGISGLRKCDQMRRGDAAVKSSLMMVKAPILGARWYIKPASESTRDVNAANLVWDNYQNQMSISWSQVLYEALLSIDFGYYMFEKVYDVRVIDGSPRVIWKKLAPRHPMQVQQWWYDKNGGPEHVEMAVPIGWEQGKIEIPISKLLVFTHQREAGNITGISALRSAYKHWYFKENLYKIDAIQKERHGIGVPIIKLPPGFNPEDAQKADQIGRNLRVNEKAHVVLPPNWEIEWAKIEGYPVNAIDSIEHHNKMIRANVLGDLITQDRASASTAEDHDFYLRACQTIADGIRDTFNLYCIPQLIDYNYSRVSYPKLQYWFVPNIRDLSFALRNFVGADLIRPDEQLEALIREVGNLPDRDEPTDRVLELRKFNVQQAEKQREAQAQTPGQLPNQGKAQGAKPGLPRQAPKQQASTGQATTGGPTNNSA